MKHTPTSTLSILAALLGTAVLTSGAAHAGQCEAIAPADATGLRKFPGQDEIYVLTFMAVKHTDDQTYIELDLDQVPETGVMTLDLGLENWDLGGEDGYLDFWLYQGDGLVTVDDWNTGTTFLSHFLWNDIGVASIDLTSQIAAARAAGWRYLGVEIRPGSNDRFWIGEGTGANLPDPVLTVCQDGGGGSGTAGEIIDSIDDIAVTLPSGTGNPIGNQLDQARDKLADAEADLDAGDLSRARNELCQARGKLDTVISLAEAKEAAGSLASSTAAEIVDLASAAIARVEEELAAFGLAPC